MEKIDKIMVWLMKAIIIIFMAGSALGGAGIFILQVFSYLKYNVWESFTVIDLAANLGSEWATNPKHWVPIHNFISMIPVSAALFIGGLWLGIAIWKAFELD